MTKRILSASAKIKDFAPFDPLHTQLPTDAEVRDAIERVQHDLEGMFAPYRMMGWEIIDIPSPRIMEDDQTTFFRGFMEIERSEGERTH